MSMNHSASEEVQCDPLAGLKTKPGAACDFCLCLHGQGEDLKRNPWCCSVREFGSPGIDKQTDVQFCPKYKHAYSLLDDHVRACELRYDLYGFASRGICCTSPKVVLLLIWSWIAILQ